MDTKVVRAGAMQFSQSSLAAPPTLQPHTDARICLTATQLPKADSYQAQSACTQISLQASWLKTTH